MAHIVVCIKQVPDSAQIRVHPVTNTIMRQGVPTIINPYDLFSLEEAMRWRDKLGYVFGPPGWQPSRSGPVPAARATAAS